MLGARECYHLLRKKKIITACRFCIEKKKEYNEPLEKRVYLGSTLSYGCVNVFSRTMI